MQFRISVLLVAILLSLMVVGVQAQGSPLSYGSTVSGEINATTPQGLYTINGAEGDWITIYAIGTAPEFQPTLSLLGSTGQLAFNNEDHLTLISNDARISFRLPAAGAYSLLVGSFDATPGTYILTVQSTIPSISTVLTDQPVTLNIPVNAPAQTYAFTANPSASSDVAIYSNTPGFYFTATLSDSDGRIVAVVDAGVERAVFTVPAGTLSYEIIIAAADPATTGEIAVVVTGAGVAATTTDIQPTQATVDLPTDQCVAVAGSSGVNVRSGPGESYDPIGGVAANGYVQITGQNNGWYAVNYFGETGWVASSVVSTNGPCGEIPYLAYGEPEVTETPEATETVEMTEEATETMEMTEEASMTEEPEVTEEANDQTQVAPEDIDQASEINIKQSGTQSISGNISYPTGDTRDVVTFTITGFDSVTTFADIQYTLFCNGDASNISASLGSTPIACNATQTIRAQGSNNQGTGNSSITFTIEYTGGEAQYVDWQLQITPQ